LSPILRDKFLETKHAELRRMHGTEMLARPSRFLGEMPAKLIDEVRPRVQVSHTIYAAALPAPQRLKKNRYDRAISLRPREGCAEALPARPGVDAAAQLADLPMNSIIK